MCTVRGRMSSLNLVKISAAPQHASLRTGKRRDLVDEKKWAAPRRARQPGSGTAERQAHELSGCAAEHSR